MKRTAIQRTGFAPRIKPLSGLLRTATLKPAKQRKCAICRAPFSPWPLAAKVCSIECGAAAGRLKTEKDQRIAAKRQAAADRDQLELLRPRKWWLAKAKTSLHAYIRTRDEGKTCISCDTILVKIGRTGGDYDAGHFRSVGSAKHLEFEEKNIFGQCKRCNDYLSGNPVAYERGIVGRCGVAYVEALKADNAPRHLDIDDFRAIDATYKAKTKALKAGESKCE